MSLRHQHNYAGDGESLQADVMRFMAIIAFCLIAVLALVRNVEPPAAPTPDSEPAVVESEPRVEPQVEVQMEPSAMPTHRTRLEEPLAKPETAPLVPPPSTPVPQTIPQQRPIVEIAADIEPAAAAVEEMVPAIGSREPAQPAEDEEKQGLSLRFASDRDFLRLVTRGEIQVFAYQDHARNRAVLGLDRNFEFLDADPPGQVYELLPETIPRLIFAALDRATPESRAYTWGIRMPRELEGKIRGFIDRQASGELVIDRYGEVHHVAG